MASPKTSTIRAFNHRSENPLALSRRGGALIELVIILPVLFIVILGSVDICNNIFVKQFLTEVTYQGALEGTISTVSETEVIDSVRSYLEARGIENAAISVQGVDSTSFDLVQPGEMFEVVVGISAGDRLSPPVVIPHINLDARTVAVRQ